MIRFSRESVGLPGGGFALAESPFFSNPKLDTS